MKKFFNNSNFKNNQNYILWKKEKQEVFFLFIKYNKKKFLDDYLNSRDFYYIFFVLTWIFPFVIFFTLLERKYNFFVKYYIFLFFYFLFFYIFYKKFFNKKDKNYKIFIYKIQAKKIFLKKYFNKKITYFNKKEFLELIEKNYFIYKKTSKK